LGVKKDLERIDAIYQAVGREIVLMVDANNSYDFNTALKLGRELEERGVLFFEGPIAINDVEGHATLCNSLDLLIANGENLSTLDEYYNLLKNRAVDIVQPDLCFAGGLTAGLRIKVFSSLFKTPILPHVWGSVVAMRTSLHFLASLPDWNTSFLDPVSPVFEYERSQSENPLQNELATEPLVFKDGCILMSKKPGLGIEIDRKVLEKHRIT
jgi:D-galactarolactone cycloisomerase